jgi:acetyl esterase/lipase
VALELGWRFGDRREAFKAISPLENTSSVAGPVLYVIGGKDRLRVAGKAWIQTLQKQGVVAEYSEHPEMPHCFYWGNSDEPPQQFYDALERTTQFIVKHLEGPSE